MERGKLGGSAAGNLLRCQFDASNFVDDCSVAEWLVQIYDDLVGTGVLVIACWNKRLDGNPDVVGVLGHRRPSRTRPRRAGKYEDCGDCSHIHYVGTSPFNVIRCISRLWPW